jgi:hypothetical protein
MEPTITLHKLRVFKEVVERQSLTLAAQELFVSQPVVSAHVRDLEEYFGSRLLYQHGRRMLLNEAGQAVCTSTCPTSCAPPPTPRASPVCSIRLTLAPRP